MVLGIIAGLVVALAVIAGIVGANRAQPIADPSTPEGAVQAYVTALVSHEDRAAGELLDPELGCPVPLPEMYRPMRVSMSIVKAETTGDRASVVAELTEHGQGLFDTWTHRETFQLRLADGDWLVTGEPWPIYKCE